MRKSPQQEPGRRVKGKISRRTAELRKKAVDLKADGYTFAEIGQHLGVQTSYAHKIYYDALAAMPARSIETHRKRELALLDELERQVDEVLGSTRYLVSDGQPVRVDGVLQVDHEQILKAADRKLRIAESRRKLLGADAPTRTQAEVTTVDMTSNPIVQQLEARNAARRAALEEENGDG